MDHDLAGLPSILDLTAKHENRFVREAAFNLIQEFFGTIIVNDNLVGLKTFCECTVPLIATGLSDEWP